MIWNVTVTFSKIIAACTLLAGTILSYLTGDSIYFVNSCLLSGTVVTLQNAGNAYTKSKCNETNSVDFGGTTL
jgi:hypothetical protein